MNLLQRLGLVKATLPTAARQEERQTVSVATTQGRPSWDQSPFGALNPFARVPLTQNLETYEQLVQTIPGHNGALKTLTSLVGCPVLESEDQNALTEHNDWRSRLQVNQSAVGFDVWFACHVINHLTYGLAAAEVVLNGSKTDVYALQELHPRTLELKPRRTRYGLDLVQKGGFPGLDVVLNPDLILRDVHDLRDDHPWGKGLLFGTTFTSQIYTRMLQSLGNTWERYGVPIVTAVYKPPTGQGGLSDPSGTKGASIAEGAKTALNEIYRARAEGKTKDLVMVGDWEFSILGAEGEGLDIVGPGRHLLEQHVASTGLPPIFYGYQWQQGERIGAVQAGLVKKMIEAIQGHLGPQVEYLFRLRQALVGRPFDWTLKWEAPSLIDRAEDAKADLTEAQAAAAQQKVDLEDWRLGVIEAWEYAVRRRPEFEGKTKAEVLALLPNLLSEPPAPVSPFGGGGEGGTSSNENETQSGRNGGGFGRGLDLYSAKAFGNGKNGRHS